VANESLLTIALAPVTDQFKALKNANMAGSVYRVFAEEPVSMYDAPGEGANMMRRLAPGALVVGFSDPGEMRQINTADQVFGYIKRSVRLLPVEGLDPESLYDPEKRAAVESTLPPLEQMQSAWVAREARTRRNQKLFMAAFVLLILLGLLSTLLHSPAPVK